MQNQAMQEAPACGYKEGIFRTLDELYHQSRHILAKNTVIFDDVRRLSGYIASVRTLLNELEFIEGRIRQSSQAIASLHDLRERYWELEGMVKEARNTLDRQQAVP
jgi:hypothetical protein